MLKRMYGRELSVHPAPEYFHICFKYLYANSRVVRIIRQRRNREIILIEFKVRNKDTDCKLEVLARHHEITIDFNRILGFLHTSLVLYKKDYSLPSILHVIRQ